MNEEQRMILFVISVFLLLIIFNKLFPPPVPVQNVEKKSQKKVSNKVVSQKPKSEKINNTEYIKVTKENFKKLNLEKNIPYEEKKIETKKYIVTFSNKGGVIKSIILKEYSSPQKGKAELLIQNERNIYPFLIKYKGKFLKDTLKMDLKENSNCYDISFLYPQLHLKKHIIVMKNDYLINVFFEIEKNSSCDLKDIELLASTGLKGDFGNNKNRRARSLIGALVLIGNKLEQFKRIKEDKEFSKNIIWSGTQSKYFMMICKRIPSISKVIFSGLLLDDPEFKYPSNFLVFSKLPSKENKIEIFAGPKDYHLLKKYNWKMEKVIFHSMLGAWFRFICLVLHEATYYIYKIVHNYGVAILILTLIVKILLYPFTYSSMKSISKMQLLQPKINEIKEKYKDPKKQQQEILKLWKEYNVNPMGGCLPLLLQMPIFIALYRVFYESILFRGAPFILWINDLSRPDNLILPFSLPIIGNSIHFLPIFNGITMFIQQKLSVKDPNQKGMVYFMPIFLTFILYSLPSGLLLYWTFSNILSIIQQKIIDAKIKHETKDLHKNLKEV